VTVRLPWPFGRSAAAPAQTEPNTEPGAGPRNADASAAVGSPAPPTRAWASLPPIQRVSGEPPLVAPARTFLEDVPGAQPLPPIVGQLGHDVTPLAPAGLVAAPVHSVAALTSHASLVDRPVQRRPADPIEATVAPSEVSQIGPAPSTSQASTASALPAAMSPATPAPTASPAPADEPVRHLAVVKPGAESEAPARSLTRADAWTPPSTAADRPLVHRTNVQASAQTSAATPASAASPATPARSMQALLADGAGSSAAMIPSAQASVVTTPPAGAPAAPQVRRPGLGAPLPSAPPTAVQRSTLRLPPGRSPGSGEGLDLPSGLPGPPMNRLAGSEPLHTTVQRRGAAARTAPTGTDGDLPVPARQDRAGSKQAPYVGSPLTGDLPSLPVVSRSPAAHMREGADIGPGDGAPVATADSGGASPPGVALSLPLASSGVAGGKRDPASTAHPSAVQRTQLTTATTPATAELRPLAGARQLRPSAPALADHETAASPGSGMGGPVLASSGGGSPDAGSPIWTNPLASDSSQLPVAPRRASDDGAGMPVYTGVAAQPVASGASMPVFTGVAGLPVASGTGAAVQRSHRAASEMTLARPQVAIAAAGSSATAGQGSTMSPAGPTPGIVAGSSGTTVVQMTPAQALATPVIAPTATAIVQRADGAAPPADEEAEGRSEGELEELARALFPRIQRQLRMEYVYEREARGLPFDS
jgi:hypothetical protein